MNQRTPAIRHGVLALTAALLSACGMEGYETPPAPPPPVTVTTLKAEPLTVTEVFPGRVAALRVAEIRPQVSGIVQRRLFEEGAEVRAGQALFAINAAPFKAEASVAAAALKRAEASLARTQQQVDRLAPLARAEAVSRQSYDDAVTERDLAAADVAQARATHERRKLDVAFSTVDAPIAGRIDQALQTEGALVAANDSAPMARIVQIDQVYVDVRQPASALGAVRRQLEAASAATAATAAPGKGRATAAVPVTVLQSGGEPMDLPARVLFSGMSVDAGTGDVLLRVLVENPRRELLPGMFVRAQIPMATYAAALRVPQEAVSRGAGGAQVWVLDGADQARPVAVTLGELTERRYRVANGLRAGDRVVVTGADRLSAGVKVQLVAADAASAPAAAGTPVAAASAAAIAR
ncbi:efflux RND transporter periplasmic adaptor subunit [Mitsuaria sp. GD03876]|uniref:efflux RND transporter periplasmic adaptor subunit n=1 Tax=Mitsuaria sp. GD03876 TaxID=2975399 RepID=UPI0024471D3F|nr:efflux RND transporter periplasmic adaptor subunit [Mitsuaria sp. GD03876]MDH0868189.1 efflux RND transporter periplasmic adaptor subunit [Mitsuaria sp. GD03876]